MYGTGDNRCNWDNLPNYKYSFRLVVNTCPEWVALALVGEQRCPIVTLCRWTIAHQRPPCLLRFMLAGLEGCRDGSHGRLAAVVTTDCPPRPPCPFGRASSWHIGAGQYRRTWLMAAMKSVDGGLVPAITKTGINAFFTRTVGRNRHHRHDGPTQHRLPNCQYCQGWLVATGMRYSHRNCAVGPYANERHPRRNCGVCRCTIRATRPRLRRRCVSTACRRNTQGHHLAPGQRRHHVAGRAVLHKGKPDR